MKLFNVYRIFGVLSMTGLSYGGLISTPSVAELAQTANLIIVGAATTTPQVGPVQTVAVQVDRIVKGDSIFVGQSIAVRWNRGVSQIPGPSNAYGLWFLKGTSSGWQVLPVVNGDIPFAMLPYPVSNKPLPAAYSYGSEVSVLDRLAAELASALMDGTIRSFQLVALHSGILEELRSPIVATMYRRMADSASLPQRALGLSGLILAGDVSALTAAANASTEFATQSPLENGVLLRNVRDRFRPSDPTAIAVLGQSVLEPKVALDFREAAAHALAAIHTPTTLPYLAALLEDNNSNLRIEAIGGLGAFANGLPTQTLEAIPSLSYLQLPTNSRYQTADTIANFAMGKQAISQKEFAYLTFWKTWWSQQRTGLGF